MSSRRRATPALLLLRSAIRTSMHEDADASAPDFHLCKRACKEDFCSGFTAASIGQDTRFGEPYFTQVVLNQASLCRHEEVQNSKKATMSSALKFQSATPLLQVWCRPNLRMLELFGYGGFPTWQTFQIHVINHSIIHKLAVQSPRSSTQMSKKRTMSVLFGQVRETSCAFVLWTGEVVQLEFLSNDSATHTGPAAILWT
jgi:hypothetical protein